MIFLNDDNTLVRAATPENVGIKSETVTKMMDYLEESGTQFHSLMIIRNGKVAAECYRYPFQKDIPHTMYSCSKTVTSTAVGIAIGEGYLSLDTKIADWYPEYRNRRDKNDYFDKMTVRHLLSMTSGKTPNYVQDKRKDDWVAQLFGTKWKSEPGAEFAYLNENMYVLCNLLQKVTKMTVVDYLMPRLFEPLGIERPYWETDKHGVEGGGWGIYLKTEDLAKIMLCYLEGGKWNGRQVIPERWTKEATANQPNADEELTRSHGYGFGIWLKGENEYNACGMFSQMGYVFEKENCVFAYTACCPTDDTFYKARDILRDEGFCEPDENAVADEKFKEDLNSRCVDFLPINTLHPKTEKMLEGKTVQLRKTLLLNAIGFPVSVLHLAAVFMSKYHAGNIDNINFDFNGDELTFTWSEGAERNTVLCGMDGKYRFSPITLATVPFTAGGAAAWQDEKNLDVYIRPLESLCQRKLHFTFEENGKVKMKPTSSPSSEDLLGAIEEEMHNILKGIHLDTLTPTVMKTLKKAVEPTHKGRIK